MMQDLADIAEGIEVVHASDLKKQREQEKRDRKIKRQEAKRRLEEREVVLEGCSEQTPEQFSFLNPAV